MTSSTLHTCKEEGCERAFLHPETLSDHALAVHTFNEKRALVQTALREKYSESAGILTSPKWVYVADQAEDWVVFEVEGGGEWSLYKSTYSIAGDNVVSLGDATKVIARTIYEPLDEVAAAAAHVFVDANKDGKCDVCGMPKKQHSMMMAKSASMKNSGAN